MRIVFAGGGTGGHLYPALSVCREIRARNPGSRIDWVGSRGRIEERVVPVAGISFRGFNLSGIDRSRKGFFAIAGVLTAFFRLAMATVALIADFLKDSPRAVVVSGAYISAPAAVAAILTRVPLFVLEQNSIPGMANRLLSPFAAAVFVTFPSSVARFPSRARVVVTGNPLREGIIEVRRGRLCDRHRHEAMRTGAAARFGLDLSKRLMVVMGGSLGSGSLTLAFLDALGRLSGQPAEAAMADAWQFLVITGGRTVDLPDPGIRWKVLFRDYVDEMDLLYAAADAMVVRAGASTVTEILALGMPSIIVPWSGSAEGHQMLNASLPGTLGCRVIDETGLDRDGLAGAIAPALFEVASRSGERGMILSIASGGRPFAGPVIAEMVLGLNG